MPNFLRSQTYPYADSSTGPFRGLLVRKYPCWDAQGLARDTFTTEIAGKIKTCLEQCLPESNSFVGFSLFMVGKSPEKTKPTVMIVSDDKSRRKAAFQMVKSKNILTMYPGFELGHCSVAAEFEDLRQLGSNASFPKPDAEYIDLYEDVKYLDDEFEPGTEVRSLLSAEVCALEYPSWKEPTRIHFHTSSNSHSHNTAIATCGGLFQLGSEFYALAMAHAIYPIRHAITSSEPQNDSSSQSDSFEITGTADWDEDDEENAKTLTTITSHGSKTSSENSGSEESPLKPYDSHLSSGISVRTHRASIVHEEDCTMESYEDEDEEETEIFDMCERIGSVVSVDEALDIAVIQLAPNRPTAGSFYGHSLTELADSDPTNTSVIIKTTHRPEIRGERSMTPFYTRLPGKSIFVELYSVQLCAPVRHGDSGSWAFNDKGELVGFVIAGNPKTGSCLLLPSRSALFSMWSLLQIRESSAGIGNVKSAGRTLVGLSPSLPDNWESDYDGNRWCFRYKPTGRIQYRFPQPGDELVGFFDVTRLVELTPEERLRFEQEVKRRNNSSSNNDTERDKKEKKMTTATEEEYGLSASDNWDNSADFLQDHDSFSLFWDDGAQGTASGKKASKGLNDMHWSDTPDEDTMTVGSSLPPPSLFSYRTGRGTTPSPIAYSTVSTGFEDILGASLRRESFSRGDGVSATSFASKETFLEQQAGRLRRELERAWEIIQEKDKRLQGLITFNRDHVGQGPVKDAVFRDHSELGFGQDPRRKPSLPSPLEQSYYQPASMSEDVRKLGLEMPPLHSLESTSSLLSRIKVLEAELETDRSIIDETRVMWRTQTDANEALDRENRELRRGVAQAIEAIHQVHGDRKEANDPEGMLKIVSNLHHLLHPNAELKPISDQVKIRKESEDSETRLMDIAPFPDRRSKRRGLTFEEYITSSLTARQKRSIMNTRKYKRNSIGYSTLPPLDTGRGMIETVREESEDPEDPEGPIDSEEDDIRRDNEIYETDETYTCSECGHEDRFEYIGKDDEAYCKQCRHQKCEACKSVSGVQFHPAIGEEESNA
ncbi:hypothetical protein F4859DRAFT_528102 [Xylaria cf. heliscus]|nr:hypothetical protein F4859DRAFT_528102 [Xylaria cf. heliscus]